MRCMQSQSILTGAPQGVSWIACRVRDLTHFTICSLIPPFALNYYHSFLPYYIFQYSPPTRDLYCRLARTIRLRLPRPVHGLGYLKYTFWVSRALRQLRLYF